jgi:hypothetical protein
MIFREHPLRYPTGGDTMTEDDFWAEIAAEESSPEPQSGGGVID